MLSLAQLISEHQKQFAKIGFFILVLFIFGFMSLAAATDMILALRKPPRPTIGDHFNGFVASHPWVAAFLAFGLGALIAHLFLHLKNG